MRRVQGRSSRTLLAAAVAVAATAMSAGSASAVTTTLYPDLKTGQIKQNDLMISKPNTKRAKLEITNEVGNIGKGPVEIATGLTSTDCDANGNPDDDVVGTQKLYQDDGDGVFDRDQDTTTIDSSKPPLCMIQRDEYYWQVWNLARYTLTSIRTGDVAREKAKIAYCTVDSNPSFPGLPGYIAKPYYPRSGPNGLCQPGSTLGISIGWADIYSFGLPGQQLSLEGLTGGRYCLTSEANPAEVLEEGGSADPYANNARSVLIRLRLTAGTVEKLGQGCDV